MTQDFEVSSGNVFVDLGFHDAAQELLKAQLTLQIHRLLTSRQLTQVQAAKLLDTTQPQISALMQCRPVSVSVGRLLEFLIALGQNIEVSIKPVREPAKTGQMTVYVEAEAA